MTGRGRSMRRRYLWLGALLAGLVLLGGACGGGSHGPSSEGGASPSADGGSGKSPSFPFDDENGVQFRVTLQVPAQIVSSHEGSFAPQGDEFAVVSFTLHNLEATRSEAPETLFLGRVLLKTSAGGAATACVSNSTQAGYCTLGPVTIEYPGGSDTELAPGTSRSGDLVVDVPTGSTPADLAFLPVTSTAVAGIPGAYGSLIALR